MVGLPNRRRGAAALARAFLVPALAAALRTGKVVRRTYEPWLFAQRFCFRGGDSSGSDHSGTFTYRVKSYGLWMLIFTEENFESFKRIQEADYSDMTLQERFDKAEIGAAKGSDLGRFPLVSADFWTNDHLSERS